MSENLYSQSRDIAVNLINEIKKSVKGKDEIIKVVLTAMIAKGHILLEDMPGVGKTTLALAFSKTMQLKYNRIQFTPDVMPSDITGYSMFNKDTNKFSYVKGAVLCNLFLADEINRTSSKTQSALLQAMEEGMVSVDQNHYKLPTPFTVIATQNPIGYAGTQMLPESQLDRFAVKISMGYPDMKSELNILQSKQNAEEEIEQVVDTDTLENLQQIADSVFISDELCEYIIKLANLTRENPLITLGVSPRGTIALMRLSKAAALIEGRDFVLPEDIERLMVPAFAHRLVLKSKAISANRTAESILSEIGMSIAPPRAYMQKR